VVGGKATRALPQPQVVGRQGGGGAGGEAEEGEGCKVGGGEAVQQRRVGARKMGLA
jgi:hypothetical protein